MRIECADAKLFLRETALVAHSYESAAKGAYDYVHLDPFGCVVPYLDLALDALPNRGVLGVTATDAATLNGVDASHITVLRTAGAAADHVLCPAFPEGAYLTAVLLHVCDDDAGVR